MAATAAIDDSMTGAPTIRTPSAVIHVEYDINSPPPRPGKEWTRFVCISDTHSRTFPVPDGDVLLHSGDLTNIGWYKDFRVTMEWLYSLPHPKKIIIAGNHDLTLDNNGDWYAKNWGRWHWLEKQDKTAIMELLRGEAAVEANIVYLEDEKHEFRAKEGGRLWSVFGSPWSPWFHNWAFNYERGKPSEDLVSTFPKTDILLTHGPPYGIFDTTLLKERVGCEALAARLPHLRPRLHVFGHIHEAHGALVREWDGEGAGDGDGKRTVFVNAANWPMGPRARRDARAGFGEAPFQPVIVDLLDNEI